MASLTRVADDLRSHDIDFTFERYPGAHEWKVWRHWLADMAPMLFQQRERGYRPTLTCSRRRPKWPGRSANRPAMAVPHDGQRPSGVSR